MSIPKVSIIMPSLNVAPYIRQCIESAINQTLQEIEIICVDAGSTDGTVDILREYEQKDNRIKLIHSDKKSYGYQVNLGFDLSQGEYIAILETDDMVDINMYSALSRIADCFCVDIVKADFCRFTEENNTIVKQPQKIAHNGMYNKPIKVKENVKDVLQNVSLYTWSGIYRRSFLQENNIRHNETPGASYQDNGFWFLTMASATQVYFYDAQFYMLRRDNPNSSFYSKGKVYCIRDEYEYILKILNERPDKYSFVMPYYWAARLGAYIFNYNRIAPEFKEEFLIHFHDVVTECGSYVDSSLFSAKSWKFICGVKDNPSINNPALSTTDRSEKNAKFITRVRWCFEDHGFWYTVHYAVNRILVKLHLKSNTGVKSSQRDQLAGINGRAKKILEEINRLDRRNEDRTNRIISEIKMMHNEDDWHQEVL